MKRIVDGPHVVEWVAKRTNEYGSFGAAVGIGLETDGKLVGGVVFNDWNGANVNIHVASDGCGHWLTRQFLHFIFHYAFDQLKVKRVTGIVGEGNKHAQRFDEKVGFVLETRLKDAHPTGDLLVYKMTREECRWLKERR